MIPREAKPARCAVHRLLVPLLFLAVLGMGMAVRLHRIGEEGLHADEMTTLMWVHEPTFQDAFGTARKFDPPMTPVYFLVQYAWVRAFGFGLPWLHLLSVLFSAATLAAVFALGRKIAGARAGLFAMLLLAVSPIHVYYSLEIRNYSLTALLGVLSLLTLLRGVERPGWPAWTLNFAVDLLLGLSHLFANLLFVPQALFLLLCHRRRCVLFPWLMSHALVTAAVVVWLGTCDFSAIRHASAYMPPLSSENGLEMVFSITGASYRYVGSAPVGLQGAAGWPVVVLFALGLVVLLGNAVRSRHRGMGDLPQGVPGGTLLPVLAVLVPPLLLAAMTVCFTHCFFPRYVLCSAVAAPVVLAAAAAVARPRAVRAVLASAMLAVALIQLVHILPSRPQRAYQRPICRFLKEAVKPGDYLVMLPPYADRYVTEIEMLAPASPKRLLHKGVWDWSDYANLKAWHAQGIQVWLLNRLVPAVNAECEVTLEALGLPFQKYTFHDDFPGAEIAFVLYCIPANAAGASVVPSHAAACFGLPPGGLRGWLAADRTRSGDGISLVRLAAPEHPFTPAVTQVGVGIQTGGAGANAMPFALPQDGAVTVRADGLSGMETSWSLVNGASLFDCRMRCAPAGKHALDLVFQATPRTTDAGNAPVSLALTLSVRGACSPALLFPEDNQGGTGWRSRGETPAERGGVLLPVPASAAPVFFGRADGDLNDATSGDTMALALMFDRSDDIRVAVEERDERDCFGAARWAFLCALPKAEPGESARTLRARLVFKPFTDAHDVLAGYDAWRNGGLTAADDTAGMNAILPPLLCPGVEENDLAALTDRVYEANPAMGRAACEALLDLPLYRFAAADRLDYLFNQEGRADPAFWKKRADREGADAFACSRLGEVLRRMGAMKEAGDAFALGLQREPDNQECLLGAAEAAFAVGETESGLRFLDRALSLNAALLVRAAGMCMDAGRSSELAGEMVDALALYRRAAGLLGGTVPSDPARVRAGEAFAAVGMRQMSAENPRAAVELYRMAVTSQSGQRVYLCDLAAALEAAGDPVGAESVYRDVLRREPGHTGAALHLAGLLADRGGTGEALSLLESVVAAHADLAGAAADVCAAAARKRMDAGDAQSAAVLLRRGVGFSPANLAHSAALGVALEAINDARGALEAYRRVLDGAPDSPVTATRIDALIDAAGGAAARVAEWKRIAAAHPDAAVPQLHLGLALEVAGDAAGAEAAYHEALARNPELVADSALFNRVKGAAEGAP